MFPLKFIVILIIVLSLSIVELKSNNTDNTIIDTLVYDTEIIESQATESSRPITLNWILMRFIPSTNWTYENTNVHNETNAAIGFRWQITPIAYTFGLNDKLSRFRYFMVDPLARNSGSIELFLQPEWNNFKYINHKWAINTGARLYLPLSSYGEHFSTSFAVTNYVIANTNNLKLEVGAYTLFGVFGVQFGYLPNPAILSQNGGDIELPKYNVTFSLKYF